MAGRTNSEPKETKERRVNVPLPDETAKILEETAEAENRSVTNLAQTILRDWAKGKESTVKPYKNTTEK